MACRPPASEARVFFFFLYTCTIVLTVSMVIERGVSIGLTSDENFCRGAEMRMEACAEMDGMGAGGFGRRGDRDPQDPVCVFLEVGILDCFFWAFLLRN